MDEEIDNKQVIFNKKYNNNNKYSLIIDIVGVFLKYALNIFKGTLKLIIIKTNNYEK